MIVYSLLPHSAHQVGGQQRCLRYLLCLHVVAVIPTRAASGSVKFLDVLVLNTFVYTSTRFVCLLVLITQFRVKIIFRIQWV